MPFIETATRTGSGVLIEGGYVVTNYHVVWPYDAVRVVFPDGTELQGVPVVGWDPMADLAVLGPVDVSASPLRLVDGEDMVPGTEVFLLGYPAEVDLFPVASITRGILSRFREWERLGMTYLQTDAAIAGGQSGGALVNSEGEVVGISTFSFSEAGFSLATSASDDAVIVERLIHRKDPAAHERLTSSERGTFEFDIELANIWDARTFVFEPAAGSIHEFWLESTADGWLRVFDPFGLVLEVDDNYTGWESGHVEVQTDAIHFLQVTGLSSGTSTYTVGSTIRLRNFNDPDDGLRLSKGDTLIGTLDHFADWDWFSLRLDRGNIVRIVADSVGVDTLIYVDFPGSTSNQVVYDDDSGGGLFGTNSELVYHAPFTSEYYIVVTGALDDEIGGYFLSVESTGVSAIPSSSSDTFTSLVADSPILSEFDLGALRDLAISKCIMLDNGVTFQNLFLDTISEADSVWDIETLRVFLSVAVYGLCPEDKEEMEEWIDQLNEESFVDGLTFDILMISDPVFGRYEIESLRELATWACDMVSTNTGFDDLYSSIYAEGTEGWDLEKSLSFLVAAIHGLCPNYADAIDRWVSEG